MTDRSKLLALAEAVEKLKGPDNATDAAIFAAVYGFPEQTFQQRNAARPKRSPPLDRMRWLEGWGVSAYTASIDAAVTIVPEGCGWSVSGSGLAGVWSDEVLSKPIQMPNGQSMMFPAVAFEAGGKAKNSAMALCAAALRVRSLAQAEALA